MLHVPAAPVGQACTACCESEDANLMRDPMMVVGCERKASTRRQSCAPKWSQWAISPSLVGVLVSLIGAGACGKPR